MPAPRLGISLYGEIDRLLFDDRDVYGWRVPEIEQEYELQPGLERIASQLLAHLVKFGRGEQVRALIGLSHRRLEGNPYWSPEIDVRIGSFPRERYVRLLPVDLAKTQDYLGHVSAGRCSGAASRARSAPSGKAFTPRRNRRSL